MIFKKIMLKDFRPYYNVQTIDFVSGEKNITLIKAENGTGKTTLLEAFKWCLYGGELNLPNKNIFMNEKAFIEMPSGSVRDVRVQLTFEEEGTEYVLTRINEYKKKQTSNSKISELKKTSGSVYLKMTRDGKVTNEDKEKIIEEIVTNILPKDINFFFDGERLKQLEDKKEIKDSIIKILKIETLEQAKKDVSAVKMAIQKRFATENANEKKLLDLEERKKVQERDRDRLKDEINKIDNQITIFENAKLEYERKLNETIEDMKKNQNVGKELEQKDAQYKIKSSEVQSFTNKYLNELSKKSYLILGSEVLKKALNIIESSSLKGKIPSNIKNALVDDIISEKKCICGREITEVEEEYLRELLKIKGTTGEVEELFYKIKIKLQEIKMKEGFNKGIYKVFQEKRRELLKINREIQEISQDLERIRQQYDQEEQEAYTDIQKNIKDIEMNIKEANKQKQNKMRDIGDKESLIASEMNNIRILKNGMAKENRDRKKLDFAEELEEVLKKLYDMKIEKERENLEKKLKTVYDRVTRKGYVPYIRPNFDLGVKKLFEADEDAALSEGENKILTLCFIGTLVNLARELKKSDMATDIGGIYPIVLDSPYGTLDMEHKKQMTNAIYELSDQIIIFASSSQWSPDVAEIMEERVGKTYYLKNENPKNSSQKISFEFTTIREMM